MGMETIGLGLVMIGASALQARATAKAAKTTASAQLAATEQAKEQASQEAEQAREQMRMAQSKEADISSILQSNTNEMLSGGETLLTGATGVDNSEMTLGKKSQLG